MICGNNFVAMLDGRINTESDSTSTHGRPSHVLQWVKSWSHAFTILYQTRGVSENRSCITDTIAGHMLVIEIRLYLVGVWWGV